MRKPFICQGLVFLVVGAGVVAGASAVRGVTVILVTVIVPVIVSPRLPVPETIAVVT